MTPAITLSPRYLAFEERVLNDFYNLFRGETLNTAAQSATDTQPQFSEGCTAITARTGVLKRCGCKVLRDGLCQEHLERKAVKGV